MPATLYTCEVRGFRELTPTVFEITFEPIEGDPPLRFRAGQFVSIVVPGAGPKGRDLRRAYSIASAPEARPVELCVKLVEDGPGTSYLRNLRPGDRFKAYAPYGSFVYKTTPDKNVCFVSTGTGLAPFRSMMFSEEFRANPPRRTICLFGVPDESEILYADDFEKADDVEWIPALSRAADGWKGFRGRVTHYLQQQDAEEFPWLDTEYYLCGNGAMIDEVKKFLLEKGVPKQAIHTEIYFKPKKKEAEASAD